MAIIGNEPTEKESNQGDFEKPGPHRYIGVGIVIALVFLVLLLWWAFAPWPRRKMRSWGWISQQPESLLVVHEKPSSRRVSPLVDQVIMPKPPEAVTTKEARKHSINRKPLEPWELELERRINWEMQRSIVHYEPTPTPDHPPYTLSQSLEPTQQSMRK